MAGRHIALRTWLEALHMTEYEHLFHLYGGVEDLIYASESEIRNLGITNGAHRAKIVSSLRVLRAKYEKGRVTGSGVFSLQRSNSNSYPTSPTGIYPDEFDHVIASPEKLQLDLQRELSGDQSELRSQAWYHGTISRQRAESLVAGANGDFLVRDCISRPGDFVLTCRWKGIPLNFMINAIVGLCAPGQLPPLTYRFEEDAFPSIQQLVGFYQSKEKPVTVVSGALLKNPISRSMPLSYYDIKYGALASFASVVNSGGNTPSDSPKPSPFVTPAGSPEDTPEMYRRGVTWTGSQPVLNSTDEDRDPFSPSLQRHDSIPSDDTERVASSISKGRMRAPSLDRCDSLPVISVTPPVSVTARPDYTANFNQRTGTSNGVGNRNQSYRSPQNSVNYTKQYYTPPAGSANTRMPQPVTSHMRSGSAPALMPTEENNRFQGLITNMTPDSKITEPGTHGLPSSAFWPKGEVHQPTVSGGLGPKSVRGMPFGGRLASAASEGELTNPPPPKPSRIPSVKYKQKPHVVIRRQAHPEEDDDRDYSDYFQVKEEPSWLQGQTESAPKFLEEPRKHFSPSPSRQTLNTAQTGRRGNRLARDAKPQSPLITSPHTQSSSSSQPTPPSSLSLSSTTQIFSPSPQSQPHQYSTSLSSTPSIPRLRHEHGTPHHTQALQGHRDAKVFQHKGFHEGSESPPMTPTYQIVARSRSFQHGQIPLDESDYDNNFGNSYKNNNVTSKGYQTLPNRSSRSKMPRPRKASDQNCNDYDVPREHNIDDITNVFNFHNNNNDKTTESPFIHKTLMLPPKCFPSVINPDTFISDLLPIGHKALDPSIFPHVKKLLLETSPRDLALTLTCYDIHIFKIVNTSDLCLGITSGLELLTLPQGAQLRRDGLERWECLRLFVMTTLLACPTVAERVKFLALWIQTCLELKTAATSSFAGGNVTSNQVIGREGRQTGRAGAGGRKAITGTGNLFSFTAVMSALGADPVRRLTDTWLILRQSHTTSAYTFDTRLRPALAALNDASADLPVSNVSVPYVTPACILLESISPVVTSALKEIHGNIKTTPPSLNPSPVKSKNNLSLNNNEIKTKQTTPEYFWEVGLDPVGASIDVLLTHLDTARVIAAQGPLYRSTSQSLMMGFKPNPRVWAALSTDFHLLFMWGEKGWVAEREERKDKLMKILTLLSHRYQVPGDDGTEV